MARSESLSMAGLPGAVAADPPHKLIHDKIAIFRQPSPRMNIQQYYQLEDSQLSFTRQQASDFAKGVAGDFNPIHDPDSKRFCVPGDLLFSAIINHYGLRQKMIFNFSGMVGDDKKLLLPDKADGHLAIVDSKGKKYLAIESSGERSNNAQLIESLTKHYVEFSSQAFPSILLPLMSEQNVMVNPDRPLIIYDSMSFELERLDIDDVTLRLTTKLLEIHGKRGDVTLEYDLFSGDQPVGRGCKRMVLSGLREYDGDRMDRLVHDYNQRKLDYTKH